MKKIFKLIFCLMILISVVFIAYTPQTDAAGMPVFDATNYAQNVQSYMDQIRNTLNSFTILSNQMTQIAYEAQNMQKMNSSISGSSVLSIQQSIAKMMNLIQNIKGIALNYENAQYAWDSTYPAFEKYNGMSGGDYANQSKIMRTQTSNAIYDAIITQGLIAQIGNDSANLITLLNASASADGALAAIQAGNLISAMVVQQLMKIQQLMATSYRAEASYYQENVERQAAAAANVSKMTINAKNTLIGPGNGDGFPDF
ncbi:MAG: hypothetical protein ACM3YE_14975 [Bacteroidota bacterium]